MAELPLSGPFTASNSKVSMHHLSQQLEPRTSQSPCPCTSVHPARPLLIPWQLCDSSCGVLRAPPETDSCHRVACLPISPVRPVITACDPVAVNGMITGAEMLQAGTCRADELDAQRGSRLGTAVTRALLCSSLGLRGPLRTQRRCCYRFRASVFISNRFSRVTDS